MDLKEQSFRFTLLRGLEIYLFHPACFFKNKLYTMTQKEKADELVGLMYDEIDDPHNSLPESERLSCAKQCSIITVNEIISACEYNHADSWNTDWWNKVKDEINKL